MSSLPKPELFTDSQTNHLLGTFRHIDHLLEMIEQAVTNRNAGLFPEDVQDLSAEQKKQLLAFIAELRSRMAEKMDRYGLAMPGPKTTTSHAITSALSFIGIALDDLRPREMRGYGAVSDKAAAELQEMIGELHSVAASAMRKLKRGNGEAAG